MKNDGIVTLPGKVKNFNVDILNVYPEIFNEATLGQGKCNRVVAECFNFVKEAVGSGFAVRSKIQVEHSGLLR